MKAIILAAGEGTRMRPLTYSRPKAMLPLANKPILEHLLVEARKAGIADFIFIFPDLLLYRKSPAVSIFQKLYQF